MSRVKNHLNILSYERFFLSKIGILFIEMELADQNLAEFIESKGRLEEINFLNYFKQIVNGLHYAHNLQMAHLDLKPQNILLFDNICKISDWGGSYQLKNFGLTSIKQRDLTISKGYCAPEIENFEEDEEDSKQTFNYYSCDIYSLGIIGFRCLGVSAKQIRLIPLNNKEVHESEIMKIMNNLKDNYSQNVLSLLKLMLTFEPEKRPGIGEVLKKII